MCYSMFYLKHCILSKYINFEFFRPDTERLVPTLLIEGFYSSSTQSYEVPNNKYIKLLNSLWNISSFTLEYHWVIVAFIKFKKTIHMHNDAIPENTYWIVIFMNSIRSAIIELVHAINKYSHEFIWKGGFI